MVEEARRPALEVDIAAASAAARTRPVIPTGKASLATRAKALSGVERSGSITRAAVPVWIKYDDGVFPRHARGGRDARGTRTPSVGVRDLRGDAVPTTSPIARCPGPYGVPAFCRASPETRGSIHRRFIA